MDTTRHAPMSITSRPIPIPSASARVGWMTPKPISEATASGGRLTRVPSCWATRTSVTRDEIAIPAQMDQPASSGVNTTCGRIREVLNTSPATSWCANRPTISRKIPNIR